MPKLSKTNSWLTSSGFDDWEISKLDEPEAKTAKLEETYNSNVNNQTAENEKQNISWNEKYRPKKISELAIHPKKIEDLTSWLQKSKTTKDQRASILLITGGSGAGKRTMLETVCNELGYEIQEWINPFVIAFETMRAVGMRYQSQEDNFSEFLFQSGHYPSLQFTNNSSTNNNINQNKLLLIKDFPNFLSREPQNFGEILRHYKRTQCFPLVLILTSGGSMDSLKRQLLPPDLLQELKIHTITLNAISNTLMSRALKPILSAESRSISKEELSEVLAISAGDIRSAVNFLQFYKPNNPDNSCAMNNGFRKTKLKRKKSKSINPAPHDTMKDSPLVLFRALGKILYCKRQLPTEETKHIHKSLKCSSNYRDPLLVEPESIQERCCLSGRAYSLFLHHNFLSFYSEIEDLTGAYDTFCASDIIGNATAFDLSSGSANISDLYEGSIAARGVAFNNSTRATVNLCDTSINKWRPLHKPSWYQVSQKQKDNEIHARSIFWGMNLRSQELILTLLPYLSKITVSKKPSLANDRIQLNLSQKQFLMNVVSIQQWKSFVGNEGLNENEIVDENDQSNSDDCTVTAIDDKVNKAPIEEDEFEIIDISD